MKIELPTSDEFNFKDCFVGGDACWLITPKGMGTNWTDKNSMFRSCIIRQSDNRVVSMGFFKFTNYGEKPEFEPWNDNWKFVAYQKIDGSLIICSKHNGELIVRTRGTVDARTLPNGHEIDLLIKKYPKVFDNPYINSENWSLLLEWTTPTNIIVLREHNEPTLTLLGLVRHDEFMAYMPQRMLDIIGKNHNINRPRKYEYNSISECIQDVKLWEGKEGVVIYSSDDNEIWNNQILKKIKADLYLTAHKLCTGIKTINNVLDLFMESPRFTNPEDFHKYIAGLIDYEVAVRCQDFIEKICLAYHQVTQKMRLFENLVKTKVEHLETRREQALYIQKYCDDWQVPFAFLILDNKPPDDKIIRRAIETYL
jgi:hypothetical protein